MLKVCMKSVVQKIDVALQGEGRRQELRRIRRDRHRCRRFTLNRNKTTLATTSLRLPLHKNTDSAEQRICQARQIINGFEDPQMAKIPSSRRSLSLSETQKSQNCTKVPQGKKENVNRQMA